MTKDEIHENEAAVILAGSLSGCGVIFSSEAEEGKIALYAEYDGLLKIKKDALLEFNMLGEVMCSTLHNYTPVKKGENIAATRLIPLIADRTLIDTAEQIAKTADGIVSVHQLQKKKTIKIY